MRANVFLYVADCTGKMTKLDRLEEVKVVTDRLNRVNITFKVTLVKIENCYIYMQICIFEASNVK